MAKQRKINTKFWSDSYIVELDPIEKLLFLYLLSNQYTNLIGIYELPLRNMAFDTGIDKEMIEKILKRFSEDKRVYYIDGWMVIRNFIRHQNNSPMVIAGMRREFEEIPLEIRESLEGIDRVCIGYVYDKLSLVKVKSKLKLSYSSDFEKFWSAYPRKIAKGLAYESWKKRRQPFPPIDELVAIVEKQKLGRDWQEEDGKYIKHPTTWMNQRCWEDEIEIYKPKKLSGNILKPDSKKYENIK